MKPSLCRYFLHLPRLFFSLLWSTLAAAFVGAFLSGVFSHYGEAAYLWRLVLFGVACPPLTYFTLRGAVVRDPLYAERYERGTRTVGAHIRGVLSSPQVWVDLAILLLSLLIAAPIHPLHAPLHALAYVTSRPASLFYPMLLAVSYPLYAAVFLLAHIRARGRMHTLFAYVEKHKKRKNQPTGVGSFMIACMYPTLMLAVLCALAPLIYSVVLLFAQALGEVTVWIVVGLITAYLLVFRFTRAIVKRKKFRRALLRTAAQCGDEVIFHRRVWMSLFVGHDTPDFTLWHKGRRYDAMFLHSLRKHTPMHFDGSGTVQLHRIYRLRRVELFRTVSLQRYEFSSEGERVLIVLPTPKQLCYTGQGAYRPVDVGDRIGGYTVFNATGFLRAIERDCLDRTEILKR